MMPSQGVTVPRSMLPAEEYGPITKCPRCGALLRPTTAGWRCESCVWESASTGIVPILVPDPRLTDLDDLGHDHSQRQKAEQQAHFDRSEEEQFEIDRPHGMSRMYRFLLAEKFRRALAPIRQRIVGASALMVCGGSGMDAEFLARAGAVVITSDLSQGAASRAWTRSRRYRVDFRSIVADVEHLPYGDQSVDLVAVHDGLHHLDDPYEGLSEMARVARRWVVITEPARARVTRIAVRLGLALEIEEAGNRVARMEPAEVAEFLQAHGFAVLCAQRYAMYYRHHPGAISRLLSLPVIFPVVSRGWRILNALVGRFGNKMVVVAERTQQAPSGAVPFRPYPAEEDR